MRRSLLVFIIVLSAVMVVACQSGAETPAPQPTAVVENTAVVSDGGDGVALPIEPDEDSGVVRGRIISVLTTQPLSNTVVALAQVTRQGDDGAFVLNTASSPMNISDVEGYFIIPNVPPGEFVMVVGDPYAANQIIENPDTQMAQTYFVEQGRVTEVGEIQVDIGK